MVAGIFSRRTWMCRLGCKLVIASVAMTGMYMLVAGPVKFYVRIISIDFLSLYVSFNSPWAGMDLPAGPP